MIIETLIVLSAVGVFSAGLGYVSSPMARLRRRGLRARETVSRAHHDTRDTLSDLSGDLRAAAREYVSAKLSERLRATPIEALRQLGATNVRWSALRDGGFNTLADLAGSTRRDLLALPGVGYTSASVLDHTDTLVEQIREEPVGLPSALPPWDTPTHEFITSAWRLLRAQHALEPTRARLEQELEAVNESWHSIARRTRFRDWALRRWSDPTALSVAADVQHEEDRVERLRIEGDLERFSTHKQSIIRWSDQIESDFQREYADFSALLDDAVLDVQTRPGAPRRGSLSGITRGLPDEIARRIESHPLETQGLQVRLRRYQQFGTKFMLAQERTILGDEMGLGKTIQALAAMAHITNTIDTSTPRFLIICPASIIPNWLREIEQRLSIQTYVLQGPERTRNVQHWLTRGGVALASYHTVPRLRIASSLVAENADIDLCIVDEAHFAKNPEAARSAAVKNVAPLSKRISLMTGTPLENRFEEFRQLVSVVSPDLADTLPDRGVGFGSVSDIVAPVYLRRRQRDVLRELPERIEKEEWVDLFPSDVVAYRDAVFSKNYMAMRRTVTIGAGQERSAKVSRVGELLEEYEASEQKVLIFSFFLDVLDVLSREYGAIGVLQGALTPDARQRTIDLFGDTRGHAVLLSQIEAGGVGTNLQAASVVILMEPQWKPSTESQAIARAHRMGQTRHVIVHRMLARSSVDHRMVELQGRKQELFDAYVQESALKDASPEATERGFAQRVIEEEMARFGGASKVDAG